jgi:hypothetical protein
MKLNNDTVKYKTIRFTYPGLVDYTLTHNFNINPLNVISIELKRGNDNWLLPDYNYTGGQEYGVARCAVNANQALFHFSRTDTPTNEPIDCTITYR